MEKFKVIPLDEGALERVARLEMQAYPSFYEESEDVREKVIERFRGVITSLESTLLGVYDGEALVGTGVQYDLELNLHGRFVPAVGLGSLAVDLTRKKEGVARFLIGEMITSAKQRGVKTMLLYPFRHQFYRAFGFGTGTPYHHFYVNPLHFRKTGLKKFIRRFEKRDEPRVMALYADLAEKRNGMIGNPGMMQKQLFADTIDRRLVIELDGDLIGYFTFSMEAKGGHYLRDQTLVVKEQLHKTPASRLAMVDFLSSQADQTERVAIGDFSPDFHHLLEDIEFAGAHRMMPMITHMMAREGLGISYRVLDVQGALDALRGYEGPPVRFVVDIPRESTPIEARLEGVGSEVEIRMDLAEFSRFYHGAVRLESLENYGRLETTSSGVLRRIDRALGLEQPVCLTRF